MKRGIVFLLAGVGAVVLLLAGVGAVVLLLALAGARGMGEFRLYYGPAPVPPTLCAG